MNKLFDIISQAEGRKLEFKESLPSKSDLAKTIISFANDAGGEFYLGIIEQWGNGLKIISAELQKYPEIGLEWKEPGIAFRVAFVRKNFKLQQELQQELH